MVAITLPLITLCACQDQDRATYTESTHFPAEAQQDYTPFTHAAHVALPTSHGQARVWVKGSKALNTVHLDGRSIHLSPPYYDSLISVEPGKLALVFTGDRRPADTIIVYPRSKSFLQPDTAYSILTYGCFQPFETSEKGVPEVRPDSLRREEKLRQAFRNVGLGKNMSYRDDSGKVGQQPAMATPLMVIGSGDESYVDIPLHTNSPVNLMTTWDFDQHPRPVVDVATYRDHLNRMYGAFGSFASMQEVFHHLPSTAVWDDHEIRDGWGSHGDEYLQNEEGEWVLNPELKAYFEASKKAFYRHFAVTGHPLHKPETDYTGLQQEFVVGRTHCFLLDLRSQRDVNRHQAMDETQMKDFRHWLDGLEEGTPVLIVSSIPLFWEAPDFMESMMETFKQEMEDDITDAWSSEANVEQRNEIYRLLLEARLSKNIKPVILSGDIHLGAINRVWYKTTEGQANTLAYEMVVSGFAHRSLEEQSWSRQLANLVASDGVLAEDIPAGGKSYKITVGMQLSAAKLNFGAVEYLPDSSALHLFFRDRINLSHLSMPLEWDGNDNSKTYSLKEVKGEAKASTFLTGNKAIKQRVILQ